MTTATNKCDCKHADWQHAREGDARLEVEDYEIGQCYVNGCDCTEYDAASTTKPIKFGSGRTVTEFSREVNAPAAASNPTAATPFTVQHADWIALTKALDCSPDTPPATLALKAQRLVESRAAALKQVYQPPANPSGRGDSGAATAMPWRLGVAEDAVVFGADDSQVAHCNIGWHKNTSTADSNAALIVQAVNSFDALRDAAADALERLRAYRSQGLSFPLTEAKLTAALALADAKGGRSGLNP